MLLLRCLDIDIDKNKNKNKKRRGIFYFKNYEDRYAKLRV